MDFFRSTEFLVLIFIVAAAIVAFLAIPKSHGAVRELLLPTDLLPPSTDNLMAPLEQPSIEIICTDNGSVVLVRHGLEGITLNGAVSLKVEIKGFNIYINERLVEGNEWGLPAQSAMTTLDFVAPERYFMRYESPALSVSATLSFRNTPGYRRSALLQK